MAPFETAVAVAVNDVVLHLQMTLPLASKPWTKPGAQL
jgi:hypothetical protein